MNNTPDLSPLIKGVFVVVGIAIAIGQYSRLEMWARSQAIEAVAWKEPLPYFFKESAPHSRKAKHAPADSEERGSAK